MDKNKRVKISDLLGAYFQANITSIDPENLLYALVLEFAQDPDCAMVHTIDIVGVRKQNIDAMIKALMDIREKLP